MTSERVTQTLISFAALVGCVLFCNNFAVRLCRDFVAQFSHHYARTHSCVVVDTSEYTSGKKRRDFNIKKLHECDLELIGQHANDMDGKQVLFNEHVASLGNVHTLYLSSCYRVTDVSSLGNVARSRSQLVRR